MGSPSQKPSKPFGRYHELGLLLTGFVLTTVFGTLLGYLYQQRSWEHDHRAKQYDAQVASASQAFDEISKLLDHRLFRAKTLMWAYMGEEEGEEIQLRRREYREVVDEWNGTLNRNLALLERYFGKEIQEEFENRIGAEFRFIHKTLNAYRKHPDPEALRELETRIEKFNPVIYTFNVRMLDCIQKGTIGEVGCRIEPVTGRGI
jgi:hypothetical protein